MQLQLMENNSKLLSIRMTPASHRNRLYLRKNPLVPRGGVSVFLCRVYPRGFVHRSRLNFQFSNLTFQLSFIKSNLSTRLISQLSLLNFNFNFVLTTFPSSFSFTNHLYCLRISSFDDLTIVESKRKYF